MTAAAATAKFRWRPGRRRGVSGRRGAGLGHNNKKSSIIPRLLQLAIRNDEELLNGVTINQRRLAQNPGGAFTQQEQEKCIQLNLRNVYN